MSFHLTTSSEKVLLWHLQSVRLAIPARVVMGTWGISPFMLKMRSRGRVNAQAAQCHQSLPDPHISRGAAEVTKKVNKTSYGTCAVYWLSQNIEQFCIIVTYFFGEKAANEHALTAYSILGAYLCMFNIVLICMRCLSPSCSSYSCKMTLLTYLNRHIDCVMLKSAQAVHDITTETKHTHFKRCLRRVSTIVAFNILLCVSNHNSHSFL